VGHTFTLIRIQSALGQEQPVLVELRNVYRPEEVARHGFVYESVGRARSDVF
jgi:UDPglucose 6-dehydrogenase